MQPAPVVVPQVTKNILDGHFWLDRPISPEFHNWVAHFYPYGSTAGGQLPIHHGVEFVNEIGTPILAAGSGQVVVAGADNVHAYGPQTDFYGLLVVVQLDQQYRGQPMFNLYGHMSKVLAQVGEHVDAGQLIGRVGMTGVALGPHVHFEVREGQNTYAHTRNPELWLKARPGRGTLAARVLDDDGKPVAESLATLQRVGEDKIFRSATTYPVEEVRPDDVWHENLVMGDVPAGDWELAVRIGKRVIVSDVTIPAGKLTLVTIQP